MGEPLIQQSASTDRRKYPRILTNLYVTYSFAGRGIDAGVSVTKNANGGGFLIESFREIPVGTLFDLTIHLPTLLSSLFAKGKVVHVERVRPYGRYDVGMSLTEISEKDKRELTQYLVSTLLTENDCKNLFGTIEEWQSSIFEGGNVKR